MKPAYKGVTITRVRLPPHFGQWTDKTSAPTLYHARIAGAWYASFRQDVLRDLIDRAVARQQGKEPAKKGETVPVNASLYLAPEAVFRAQDAVRFYLEWESHRRALANDPVWYALYRCGLVPANGSERVKGAAALRFLGFVPVSPDGAAYRYEAKTDEVLNQRHSSLRRPLLHEAVEETSPVGRLLDQFRTLRADLRFREDGVHTTLTVERKPPAR